MRGYVVYVGPERHVVGTVKAPCDMDACKLVLAMWGGETIIQRVEVAPLSDLYQACKLEAQTRDRALFAEIMWDVRHTKRAR